MSSHGGASAGTFIVSKYKVVKPCSLIIAAQRSGSRSCFVAQPWSPGRSRVKSSAASRGGFARKLGAMRQKLNIVFDSEGAICALQLAKLIEVEAGSIHQMPAAEYLSCYY